MKLTKILFITLLCLFSVMSVNAVTQISYYDFEGNAIDQWSGFNGTVNGATASTIVPTFNQSGTGGTGSFFFNGSNNISAIPSVTADTQSVSMWVKMNATEKAGVFNARPGGGFSLSISYQDNTADEFRVFIFNGTLIQGFSSPFGSTEGWLHVVMAYDQTDLKIYINGSLEATTASTITMNDIDTLSIGGAPGIAGFVGYIDDVKWWEGGLNATEVRNLFNTGNINGTDPDLITLTTNLKDFYNTTNISVDINATGIINLSFSLDGASEVSVWTNQNNGTASITNISEGVHNITWIGASDNLTENFTIDLTNPSLNVSNFSEVNNYTFNFSTVINASTINISSCIVVTDQNTTTCNNELYVFTNNGNHTYNVTLTDLAGNVNTSLNNIAFINPFQNFSFFNSSGSPISNYTFGGVLFNGTLAQITTYGSIISLGNNTLVFEKLGFATTNVSFNVNLTSKINLSTNITESVIVLRFFDRETLILITGTTTVTLVGPTGFNSTTTTGAINISDINFISGAYQVIASNPAYETESIFFTYNNQEILNKDLFLLQNNASDLGTVTVQVTASTGQFVQGAICSALEWTPSQSAFLSVAEGNTNTEGSTILNIEIGTKLYKFSCTKSGTTVTSPQQIIQVSGSLVPLVLPVGEEPPELLLKNFVFSLTNSTFNATHQRITYNFSSSDNLVTESCLNQYQINGNTRVLLNQTCVQTAIGQIQIIIDINTTFSQLIVATAEEDNVVREVDEIVFLGEFSLETSLSAYGMDVFLPLLLTILGIVIGFMIVPSSISVSLFVTLVAMWLIRFFVPSTMAYSSTIFMSVVILIMLWGSKK